ncbi:hypothetical protein BGX26_001027 [Mortierella sp. AD094]|nr:hypothetical protein BGX26_001027 [Mortierella sp. AD094]
MKAFRSGRGGSSPRGKSNSTKVSAPLPFNLPSRKHEKGIDSFVSTTSTWGSPSTPSSAVLATTSPATEGYNSTSGSGTNASAAGQGGDSPQLDSAASPPFQKSTPRAWGVVAHTPEQSLEEYPTAAEAAKKTQDLHEHQNHGSINITNTTTTTNSSASAASAKRTNTSGSTTSGEPMAKTVSTLSSGADNWDEADEDESVDFLNAEAIEFADGAVLVAAAVAQTAENQKEEDPPQTAPTPTPASHREERVVDRGDVDFNRAWPNRSQPGPGSSLYQPNLEQSPRYGSQDRSHPSLWQGGQGGPNDRRLSADRTQTHHLSQRRESFGSRESYQGAPRRDSLGPKEPFSGPRRDSANYRDPQERRDSFNRPGNFNRDRDPYHHRDNDYNMDRRPSHDRPPYTSERFPDRHQRDFQLLARPKEGSNDRLGPHDPNPAGQASYPQAHHPPLGARGPHDPIHPRDMDNRATYSHAHMAPSAAVEYDRPAHVTEDQREAMRHAADEARKRREEEEKKFEEAKARARARADELAKKAEEEKLAKAKEEEAAKEAERLEKEKKEAESKENQESTSSAAAALAITDLPETVREFGDPRNRPHIKTMTEADKNEAMAQWKALPDRLVKEEAERVARIQENRRLKAEQEQPSTAASSSLANNTTPAVGPWRRSGNATSAKATSNGSEKQDISDKKDDKKPREATRSGASNPHPAPQEVRVEQLDEVMHRIEESLQARGNSAKTMEDSKTHKSASIQNSTVQGLVANAPDKVAEANPSENSVDNIQKSPSPSSDNLAAKEKPRNAKDTLPNKEETKSLPNEDKVPVTTPEATKEENVKDQTSKEAPSNGSRTGARATNGRISRSAAAAIGKGSYPAKLNGLNGSVKVSQISKIHARLSLQTAGDVDLELPSDLESQSNKAANAPLSKETAAQKSQSTKRNSLLSSGTATIFPVNVEKAAKNRGSMSFMVESEIDGHSADSNEAEDALHSTQSMVASSQWGDSKTALPHLAPQVGNEAPANENMKKAWESTLSSGQQPDSDFLPNEGAHQVHQHDGVIGNVSQGMVMAPGMYMMSTSAPGVGNPMTHMWSAPIGVESSQAGPGIAPGGVVMAGPGGGATGHPGQPFPMVVPYYPQGFPVNGHQMYYYYHNRGLPPPLAQFPGGVIAPHGSMPISPREGLNNSNGGGGGLGSPDLTSNQAIPPHSSGGSDSKAENASATNTNNSGSVLGPHHWLPRFSAAGDAPPQQAVAGGPFLMPIPASQHANIIAAANINRAPHARPFGHHQQQHHQHHHAQQQQQQARMHNTGSSSLEGNFQEGPRSPSSTEGWGDAAIGPNGMNVSNQSSNGGSGGGRNYNQGNAGSSSWGSGNGRMNANGPPGSGGSYGSYQQQQSSSSSSTQHPHPGGGYRGGRGGYNGGFGNHREFRPRGGYGGSHMGPQGHHHGQHGQGHSSNFHYGQQGNVNGPQQQHGSSPAGNPSNPSSGDHHHHQHQHQHQTQNQGSFGGGSYSHRPAHGAAAASATTNVAATGTTTAVGSSGNALQY